MRILNIVCMADLKFLLLFLIVLAIASFVVLNILEMSFCLTLICLKGSVRISGGFFWNLFFALIPVACIILILKAINSNS